MKGLKGWQSRNAVTAIRIHRWVLWWFYVGVVCGVVALVNILFRDLTRTQERMILILGVLHWCVGGLICWACEGIRVDNEMPPQKPAQPASVAPEKEWHPASEFRLPGGGQALLPSHRRTTRETIAHYGLEHREQEDHPA